MNNHASNQVNAIRSTVTYCQLPANVTIMAAVASFAPVLTQASNKLVLIDNYDIIATATTHGITLNTVALRTVIENLGYKCLNATIAFASPAPRNNALIAQVKYPLSDLQKMKKEQIATVCQTIHDAAASDALILNFGITATDLTDLQAGINLYNLGASNPRQAVITRNSAKASIATLIKEINDDLFKMQMDTMVKTRISTNQEFVNKYFLNREIIDLGKTHTKFKGDAKQSDGTPIVGAIVTLTKTGTTTPLYTITSQSDGKFKDAYIKPDNYDLKITATGYTPQTENNIHCAAGKSITRHFILVP